MVSYLGLKWTTVMMHAAWKKPFKLSETRILSSIHPAVFLILASARRSLHCASGLWILPRDVLQCKARFCYHISSVRLSVCDVGGSWPHTLKILVTNCADSPTSSLFVAQRSFTYSQENTEKFWGDYRWGGKKWRAGARKRQYLWNALR